MITSEQIDALAAAMAKAQGAMKPAIKDSTNPAFRSKYADLTSVWDACRGPLSANGIAVWQDVVMTDVGVAVTTRLTHTSGQWIECGPVIVPLTKRDAHGVGSATSYGRRYGLSAAVGIVADDDDGNSAVANTSRELVTHTSGQWIECGPVIVPQNELPPEPSVPAGYDDWYSDLVAVADEGIEALESAFKKSKVDYRRHLTQADTRRWAALKTKAAMKRTLAEAK